MGTKLEIDAVDHQQCEDALKFVRHASSFGATVLANTEPFDEGQ